MDLERKHGCPLRTDPATGEMKPCAQLDCEWFMQLEGKNPQDKDDHIKEWGCAVVWMVPSVLQVAKDVRQGTSGIHAATDSFRNEMVRMNSGASLIGQFINDEKKMLDDAPVAPALEKPNGTGV